MASSEHPRIAAFFDLDRTLLDMNSSTLWAMHELRGRSISLRQFGRVLVWNALYHLSLIDIETAFREAVGHYRGRLYDDLESETRAWFARDVAHHIRPGAAQALRDHRHKGHRLVLLTSASAFAARAARDTWELDDFLSNDFPTDDRGRLDGSFVTPLCYGSGKVERARVGFRARRRSRDELLLHRLVQRCADAARGRKSACDQPRPAPQPRGPAARLAHPAMVTATGRTLV